MLRTLELSPQQQAELRGVHELFEGIMRGILAERQVRGWVGGGQVSQALGKTKSCGAPWWSS